MNRLNSLLNQENQKHMSLFLKRGASVMGKMDKLLDENTTKNFQQSMKNLNLATTQLNEMMPRVNKLLKNSIVLEDKISSSFISITASYNGIKSAMDEFKKAIAGGELNIKDMTSDLIPTMNNTFIEVQQLMIKLEEAINQYERSPGDIIFKQEEIKKGPGED